MKLSDSVSLPDFNILNQIFFFFCFKDCVLGTARCLLYKCPLYSFDRSAVLTIWARLWNSTFLEVSMTPPVGYKKNSIICKLTDPKGISVQSVNIHLSCS